MDKRGAVPLPQQVYMIPNSHSDIVLHVIYIGCSPLRKEITSNYEVTA